MKRTQSRRDAPGTLRAALLGERQELIMQELKLFEIA